MLNGEPGTGKSYYIRHLINSIDRNFIIITPQMASCLSSASFTNFLVANSDTTFILEDCEKILLDREKFGVSDSISSILNMSDGILSDVYACKFICTFNCDINSIDQAALRKGRCVAQYHFTKLSVDKTNALLKELGYDVTVDTGMTLADIYHYGEDNNVVPKTRKKVGF
jgi:ATP-dependent 26S proteasome regulatory subunit